MNNLFRVDKIISYQALSEIAYSNKTLNEFTFAFRDRFFGFANENKLLTLLRSRVNHLLIDFKVKRKK